LRCCAGALAARGLLCFFVALRHGGVDAAARRACGRCMCDVGLWGAWRGAARSRCEDSPDLRKSVHLAPARAIVRPPERGKQALPPRRHRQAGIRPYRAPSLASAPSHHTAPSPDDRVARRPAPTHAGRNGGAQTSGEAAASARRSTAKAAPRPVAWGIGRRPAAGGGRLRSPPS